MSERALAFVEEWISDHVDAAGVAPANADARAQELPLLTVGDPEYVEHDWYVLFSRMGVLEHDTSIAGFVRLLGWLGMIATAGWLFWRGLQSKPAPKRQNAAI